MSDPTQNPPPPPSSPSTPAAPSTLSKTLARLRRIKRPYVLALAGLVLIGVAVLLASKTWEKEDEEEGSAANQAPVVYRIKRRPEPPKLGIEYHFDRNALLDSRIIDDHLVGLVAAGNLLVFDANTFALRKEKVLHRRATCLGPSDGTHLFVGLRNGAIVRASAQDLAFTYVTDVPGTPVWIGKRGHELVIAYRPEPGPDQNVLVRDGEQGRTYDAGVRPVFFVDSKDRLWVGSGDKIEHIDLPSGDRQTIPIKSGATQVRGFAELASGQVWAFGGTDRRGELGSFIARVSPGAQAVLLFSAGARERANQDFRPKTPITHVVEANERDQLLVVSGEGVVVSDATLSTWKPFDIMGAGHRDDDALTGKGQAHRVGNRLVLALERGGFLEVTSDFTRRHQLDGQNTVSRPLEIVRLADGMAFYGRGGPLFYSRGAWQPLPDTIMPPPELMGPPRPGEKERQWAAIKTVPIAEGTAFVIAKAGPPRHYTGHLHGLRDVVLTARWGGNALLVLGREEQPIEPDDVFATPNRELWSIDDQGLWSFSGGHWRLAVRTSAGNLGMTVRSLAGGPSAESTRPGLRSGIGERLHFRQIAESPFYGLPSGSASWNLIRLDSNETGGIPLIDEIPVSIAGRRLLLRDLTAFGKAKEEFLLATDHGLCLFSIKWHTCELMRPEGLGDDVSVFMRDGTRRLWLAGRGLWVLRDQKQVDLVHPSLSMLADTRIVTLAESPDGRIVIGTEDRGVVFLMIPPGWFQKPAAPMVPMDEWDKPRPHEPVDLDPGVVIRACRGKGARNPEAAISELETELRTRAPSLGTRVHVVEERVFESTPDIVVRGPEPDKLVEAILPLLPKFERNAKFSVHRRFGHLGSPMVETKPCPGP